MPIIENVSWDDVKHGWHTDMGADAILIQISDPSTFFPEPKKKFSKIVQFEFLDAEDDDVAEFGEHALFSDAQAELMVDVLQYALTRDKNVLVHCHAGICRSGAVVEFASMLGFKPTGRYRQPNLRVKHKMMKILGWTYDSDENYSSSGELISSGGILVPYAEYIEEVPASFVSANGNKIEG